MERKFGYKKLAREIEHIYKLSKELLPSVLKSQEMLWYFWDQLLKCRKTLNAFYNVERSENDAKLSFD